MKIWVTTHCDTTSWISLLRYGFAILTAEKQGTIVESRLEEKLGELFAHAELRLAYPNLEAVWSDVWITDNFSLDVPAVKFIAKGKELVIGGISVPGEYMHGIHGNNAKAEFLFSAIALQLRYGAVKTKKNSLAAWLSELTDTSGVKETFGLAANSKKNRRAIGSRQKRI